MNKEEAIERVKARFDKWSLDEEDLAALQAIGLISIASEDEKIRQALVRFFKHTHNWVNLKYDGDEIVAYLEKQNEQKTIEEFVKEVTKDKESAIKFLKSAGIMDENGVLAEIYRNDSGKPEEEKECTNISLFSDEQRKYAEKYISLNKITLIKLLAERDRNVEEITMSFEKQGEQKPAKKDEIGYDLGRERGMDAGIEYVLNHLELYGLCKPAEWSKEDKSILNNIVAYKVLNIDDLEWLKSLPERFNLQPKQEWSEEDESALKYLHELISFGFTVKFFDAQTAADMREWLNTRLKSIRPSPKQESEPMEIKFAGKIYKVYGTKELPGGILGYIIEDEHGLYDCIIHPDEVLGGYGIKSNGSPYPTKDIAFSEKPAEWSEEDTNLLNRTLSIIRWASHSDRMVRIIGDEGAIELENWLKSLCPQPHWKPSEEQMNAFYVYLYQPQYINNSEDERLKLVESLYNDLKKLM